MAEQKDENDPLNRIIKCLHLYDNLKVSDYHTLLEYLSEKRYPHLIDDYNYILREILGDDKPEQQRRKEFESIYNKITAVIKDCTLDSAIFKRNQRARETTKLFEDDSILGDIAGDEKQKLKFYIETLDTIGCYFLYSYHMGCRLKDTDLEGKGPELTETVPSADSESSVDHTLDDVIMTDKQVDELQTDTYFQHIQKLLDKRRKKLKSVIGWDLSNTRFVTKINEDPSVELPDVIPPLKTTREITPDDGDEKKEEKKIITFMSNSFGYTFYYWDHYKNKKGGENVRQNDGYKYTQLYVIGKYKDLQDELLNNTIKCISKEEFDSVIYNADMKMKSQNAKTYETYGLITAYYGLKKKAPITKEHLMSVILYSNYIILSKEFTRTHRKVLKTEKLDDVKKRNSEFAVWSRLLRETVECYGRTTQFAKNKVFYHGINGKLAFPGFCIRFLSPTLLTTQLSVVAVYSEKGVILELERGSGKLRFFNTNWLSCYSMDEGRLVMGGQQDIKIGIIYGVKESFNYKMYLRAFNYFRYWVSGREPVGQENYGTKTLKSTKEDYMILKSLFKHFDDRVEFKCKFPEYVILMFDVFRTNIKDIKIDYKQMHKHYNKIAALLFAKDDDDSVKCLSKSDKRIMISEICMLFKNCVTITVTYNSYEMPNMERWEFVEDLAEAAKYTRYRQLITINNIECNEDSFYVINNAKETKGIWKAKRKGKNGLEVEYVKNKQ